MTTHYCAAVALLLGLGALAAERALAALAGRRAGRGPRRSSSPWPSPPRRASSPPSVRRALSSDPAQPITRVDTLQPSRHISSYRRG
jgi:hypothetical protein